MSDAPSSFGWTLKHQINAQTIPKTANVSNNISETHKTSSSLSVLRVQVTCVSSGHSFVIPLKLLGHVKLGPNWPAKNTATNVSPPIAQTS